MKMNTGLIGMRCEECGSRENTFDERMGERVCDDCGLVLVQEIFEQTTLRGSGSDEFRNVSEKGLGSVFDGKLNTVKHTWVSNQGQSDKERTIIRGIQTCNIVYSSLNLPFKLTERIEEVYRNCHKEGLFPKSLTLEVRATAVVYFVLKENGTPIPLSHVCVEYGIKVGQANRLLGKINKLYKNRISRKNTKDFEIKRLAEKMTEDPLFSSLCVETHIFFEKVCNEHLIHMGKSYPSCIVYITSVMNNYRMSMKDITEESMVGRDAIWRSMKKMIAPFGLTKASQLKGKTLNTIGDKK
jgi:transcription initiation factor TFIIIB Brf1 subunit/transcription initiation factor TFIIB